MPEYLAPGVYVEETSFRSKSIEGVSTTTTGFVGPSRFGPHDLEPDVITSLLDFERVYGDGQELVFQDGLRAPNLLWHAVRAFFSEGGKRLYISRIFRRGADSDDGRGAWSSGEDGAGLAIKARFPGAYGNFLLEVTLRARPNALGELKDPATSNRHPTVAGLTDLDVVWIRDARPVHRTARRWTVLG